MSAKAPSGEHHPDPKPGTLGAVLYAKQGATNLERDWAELVQSIAAGDQLALHALYERAHRPVFTLTMRITNSRQAAEELTLDVFHDVWRHLSPTVSIIEGERLRGPARC